MLGKPGCPKFRDWPIRDLAKRNVGLVRYFLMSRNPDHFRVYATDCCRNAVASDDVSRRAHWIEAAARWIALGRQQGDGLTKLATVQKRTGATQSSRLN